MACLRLYNFLSKQLLAFLVFRLSFDIEFFTYVSYIHMYCTRTMQACDERGLARSLTNSPPIAFYKSFTYVFYYVSTFYKRHEIQSKNENTW